MAVDLHTHSTRSDGTDTPAELVRLALDAGHGVKIVGGDARNMKITTVFDLEAARFFAEGIKRDGTK